MGPVDFVWLFVKVKHIEVVSSWHWKAFPSRRKVGGAMPLKTRVVREIRNQRKEVILLDLLA